MILYLIPACYLIGSIPVAWIVTKLVTGQDLRRLGSGNVGVMNVALQVARWAGLLVFLSEAAKGVLAVFLARRMSGDDVAVGLAILAAVVGTRWSIWMGFTGGRGNTTGAAGLLLVAWQAILVGIAAWFVARFLVHSSFWATRIILFTMPLLLGLVMNSWWYVLFGALLSAIYLSTQNTKTDDHLMIKEHWPSLWAFLTGPPRHS
jgi:glycerol-3-phosphate acyltransferase PlsY